MMTFGNEMFGAVPPLETRGGDAVTAVTPLALAFLISNEGADWF
ncbi:MAG TPA: hypothetical protein VGL11_05325 [Candidatus Binatia bacterium]